MSEPAKARPDHEELDEAAPSIKVNDKRRFKEDGVPVQTSHPPQQPPQDPVEPKAPERAEHPAETERLSLELDAARKRIDELARGLVHSEQDREAFKQRMTRERDQLLDLEKGCSRPSTISSSAFAALPTLPCRRASS
jgi:molecular chaperone GrpE (heat shock protein)